MCINFFLQHDKPSKLSWFEIGSGGLYFQNNSKSCSVTTNTNTTKKNNDQASGLARRLPLRQASSPRTPPFSPPLRGSAPPCSPPSSPSPAHRAGPILPSPILNAASMRTPGPALMCLLVGATQVLDSRVFAFGGRATAAGAALLAVAAATRSPFVGGNSLLPAIFLHSIFLCKPLSFLEGDTFECNLLKL
jgi:hypothetical protein